MKRIKQSMLGVTLLEIMLVLAIAAMIIVMSVRYYQSAVSSQQANAILQQIQAITAAADSLAQSTGSYTLGSVNISTIKTLVPTNSMTTPWGTAINVVPVGATSYTVTIPLVPTAVCPLINTRLLANNHFTNVTACSGVTTLSYTYKANP
jgi:type II secretory pathway pseudopilin PulG